LKLCNKIHFKNDTSKYEKNIQINIKNVIEQKIEANCMVENEKATQCLMFHENIINHLTPKDIDFYFGVFKLIIVMAIIMTVLVF